MIQWDVINDGSGCGIPHIHPVISCLLQNRGITGGEAERFLSGEYGRLFSPALLPDMEAAAGRIRRAVDTGEKITVYGDYDVDGVTSVALLVRFFASLGVSSDWYIPDRKEGYGLNLAAIDRIKASGTSLVVTVDTGTTAAEEFANANQIGLDVVDTDHHECGARLPDCPVVNPKRRDSRYPFTELAGVGVALQLVSYLSSADEDVLFEKYGEYAAIGTIADIMPLVSENRVIVSRGLQKMKNPSVGILGLKKRCSDQEDLSASAVAFRIAPRLNAAGRVGSASAAAELLLCDDPETADTLADFLCRENDLRRQTEQAIFSDAEEKIARRDRTGEKLIMEMSDRWHEGVIGIVASRMVEKYNRPCLLFCQEDGLAKGSARSVPAVNIYELISANAALLSRFGGHHMAAGMSLSASNFETFRKQMQTAAAESIQEDALFPRITAECELENSCLQLDFCRELSRLEPFGAGNPQPLFLIRNLRVLSVDGVSADRHTRISFQTSSGQVIKGMFFGVSPCCAGCFPGDVAEVIGSVSENVFRGVHSLSLQIKSLNLPAYEADFSQAEKDWHLYEKTGESPVQITRSDVSSVYRAVRALSADGRCETTPLTLSRRARIGYLSCRLCLSVLEELKLIHITVSPVKLLKEGSFLRIEMFFGEKTDLMRSETFRKTGILAE